MQLKNTESIVLFSGLTDKELKQQIKVNSLQNEKMLPSIELSLCVAGLCDLRGNLEGTDLLKLFEFLILFPSREHPEAVDKYLNKWLERSK